MYSSKKLPMSLLPKVPGLRLETLAVDAKTVSLSLASTRPVADLPWGARSLKLSLLVRRFRCSVPECPRRIFAERLPSVVEPYARKTTRLQEILRLVGFSR